MTRATLSILAVVVGCAGSAADVEPLGDYTTWKRIDTYGKTPGHGDSYRIIYVNDIAETYVAGSPEGYPDGSIFVKQVHDRVGDQAGELRVIEIMRSTGQPLADDGGFIFTAASEVGGEETAKSFCWRRCHQAAPFQGAWFDYSR